MRLPGLDVVFRLAAPAVDILVKYTGVADLQVGDDEACVGPFRAGLHTGDDPLDAAPAGGPVEELLEAACLGPDRNPRGVALSRTISILPRSFLPVSGILCQTGVRHHNTAAVSTAATGLPA